MATVMKFEFYSKINLQSSTLWKFHDFSVSQILREINFGGSRSSYNAHFAILGALPPKSEKTTLISRKI